MTVDELEEQVIQLAETVAYLCDEVENLHNQQASRDKRVQDQNRARKVRQTVKDTFGF